MLGLASLFKKGKNHHSNDISGNLKDLLEIIAVHYWWKDIHGRYLGCNNRVAKLLGLKADKELLGKTDYEMPWKEQADELIKHDNLVISSGKIHTREETAATKDGRLLTFFVTKAPYYNSKGEIIGTIGTSIEITDLKNSQKRLREEKIKVEAANNAKSKFIANMSHDIRTPITGILGLTQALIAQAKTAESTIDKIVPSDPTQKTLYDLLNETSKLTKSYGKLLITAADELLQLCNEILEVVHLDTGKMDKKPEAFCLAEVVQHNVDLLQPVATHKNLELKLHIDDKVPMYLHGLRIFFDRILLNLLSNALKFTNEGYVQISVELINKHKTPISVGQTVTLQITVIDTGIGIPKDKHEQIFEHFSRLTSSYQGIYKGSGLGLYSVKRYLEAMSGTIELESEEGLGSRFIITTPFIVTDHCKRPKQAVVTTPQQKMETRILPKSTESKAEQTLASILVVEDNLIAAMAVELALSQLHCTVDVAENGLDGIEKATQGNYDLILMDIGLPDINGIKVTQRIRALPNKKKAQVPIVALTGHVGEDSRKQCEVVGMNELLHKPAQTHELQSVLEQFVFSISEDTSDTKVTEHSIAIKSLPAIDWEGCLQKFNGDEDFTRKMLYVLSKELRETQKILQKAYSEKDTERLRAEIHRCFGGILYLRLPQLETALTAFQAVVKSEHPKPAELEKTYTTLLEAIQTFEKSHEEMSALCEEI